MEIPKIMAGIPVHASVDPRFMMALMRAQASKLFSSTTVVDGESFIGRARNNLAAALLGSDDDYLMFIDSDIVFTPGHLHTLFSNLPFIGILGGLYCKKQLGNPRWVATSAEDSARKGSLLRLLEIGTGFTLVHRSVFEVMSDKCPELHYEDEHGQGLRVNFFDSGVVDRRLLSEDFWFCQKARELGFEVACDPRVQVGHRGPAEYPINLQP